MEASNVWRRIPGELITRIRADPARAPEHIALAAADLHGPAAAAWVTKHHARGVTDRPSLARLAKRNHARLSRVEGAATGLGGWTTTAADLVALAWVQPRLIFFVAAAYGYDPRDRMRPAELLVLSEGYSEVTAARDPLDGARPHPALASAQSRRGRRRRAARAPGLDPVAPRRAGRPQGQPAPGLADSVRRPPRGRTRPGPLRAVHRGADQRRRQRARLPPPRRQGDPVLRGVDSRVRSGISLRSPSAALERQR